MCIISADAENCYDRVHRGITALVFKDLGVNKGSVLAMLQSIQLMKFFLRTGWGDSLPSIGGDIIRILHVIFQGNGAAPVAWIMLSSVLVVIYKNLGYGIKVKSPMTLVLLSIMGVFFVDNTDLFIMSENIKPRQEIWEEAQRPLTVWGKLLIATGGMLKPEMFLLPHRLRME